jgi:hypothetical protein
MAIITCTKVENNKGVEFETTYENRVLYDGERNFYDDSDFYVVVWDEEAGKMRNITYATTRAWTYANSASIDFTPESDPEGWVNMVATLKETMLPAARANLLERNSKPEVGDEVRVVHGPGIDTIGTVFWIGKARGGRGAVRVGVSASGEKVNGKYPDAIWTLLTNIEKTSNELTPEDEERLANVPDERFVNMAVNNARGGYGCIVI